MTLGRSPDGHSYWAAFPYSAYARLRPAELADLWAFLQTVPPSPRPDEAHQVGLPRWPAAGFWRWRYFEPGAFEEDPAQSDAWNRGAYLGLGIGHCGECHSPRNKLGAIRQDRALSGSPGPPESAPDITPGPRGLAAWSHADLTSFLLDGMTPEGDVVGGEMGRIVEHGTAKLSPEDRAALATWLQSVPPSAGAAEGPAAEPEEQEDWE